MITYTAAGRRDPKRRGSAAFAMTMVGGLSVCGAAWSQPAGDDTPISQASPEAILSRLKQGQREALTHATMGPPGAREAKVNALREILRLPVDSGRPGEDCSADLCLYTAAVVDLKAGARRGKVTYPLYQGTIGSTGAKVYFVLSEASDQAFARDFGVLHAPNLDTVSANGVETGASVSGAGVWVFAQDAGRVTHRDAAGAVQPAVTNDRYSPLKRIKWKNRTVTVNIPFVKWGDQPGQQLPIDRGGCDPRIGRHLADLPPTDADAEVGGGPTGCEREGDKDPLNRYLGGQAVDIQIQTAGCSTSPPWTPCGWVTMKLHQTTHRADVYPYLAIFSASQADIASELGVPHTPKLALAGRSDQSPPLGSEGIPGRPERTQGVSSIVEYHNGVEMPDGGPARFQPGAISYGQPSWGTYSPILHVTWAYFDCGGGGMPNADPTRPAGGDYPFYAMRYASVPCKDQIEKLAGNTEAIVYTNKLFELWATRSLVITEWPASWMIDTAGKERTAEDLKSKHLVLDAPAPVAVIRR